MPTQKVQPAKKDTEGEESKFMPEETAFMNRRTTSGRESSYKFIPRGDVFRIFEAVEDGQVKEFNEYMMKYSKIPKKFLSIKNITNRTMLHIAC
jgi:hypothetical protein